MAKEDLNRRHGGILLADVVRHVANAIQEQQGIAASASVDVIVQGVGRVGKEYLVKRLSLCIAFVACLSGCAGVPPSTSEAPHCPASSGSNHWQCFSHPEPPPPGLARLYVFRPDFSELQTVDQPLLTINDSIEITVSRLSYSFIDLPMGHHTFRLTPRASDSPIWHLEGAFEVSAQGPFYLAVWNADTSPMTEPDYSAYGKDVAKATAVGVLTAAVTGGFAILPVPRVHPKSHSGVSEARFEVIPEDQALEVLRRCELDPAKPRKSDDGSQE